jgi:hypothetical protein
LLVASVLTVGVLVTILDVTIAGEATKALAHNIEAKLSTIRWVDTAYALALGRRLPVWPRGACTSPRSLPSCSSRSCWSGVAMDSS